MHRKRLLFVAKLLVSLGLFTALYWNVIARQGADELRARIASVSLGWLAFGFVAQLAAVGCSVLRWQRLLIGQGIHAPLRHLLGSFMIGRFFGELAPGGWTGLNGYRIYDIATRTGKLARASACIGIEMVIGWLSFGAIVVLGSFFGVRFIGARGVAIIDAFFLCLMALALALVVKPALFRKAAARLPPELAGRLRTTVDAVCAYDGEGRLVAQAALLGFGTHFFRAFIYVAAAHALAASLSVGEVFFGTSLQVFATLLPASVNGIGLREATAVALYTRGGVAESTAVLIPTLGFMLEMALSSLGGVVFLLRRVGYSAHIRVDYAEHEQRVHAELPSVPRARWPRVGRGFMLGLGAGLLAGAAIGCSEGWLVLRGSAAAPDYGVLLYGACAYALLSSAIGAGLGTFSALLGRVMHREAMAEAGAYARGAAFLFASIALALGAFRVRRDVFHEELAWKSPQGLAVLAACALAALLAYVLASALLHRLARARAGAWLLEPWGSPLLFVVCLLPLTAASLLQARPSDAPLVARPAPPPGAGNILFIVVDTLRADHLPSYGYRKLATPNLDRFARDAIRFDAAFANASWTRPSFASILTGRYAASHRTMAKGDALPDALTTLPEALRSGGYRTLGVVTNYNIAPFFNFDQGFDHYSYLEPNFVLGANDTAAKLLLVQALRQAIETARAKSGRVEVGSAYQDAETVNRELFKTLDRAPPRPFFLFVAYMDPHDPYYPHPYDGTAYARAAHHEPDPSEAPGLIRLYDGEIHYWDEQLGKLLDELQRRGLYDDLTIVLTADHGEEFQEHGGFWHGMTLYDEALHVPLFVKLPHAQRHGEVVQHFTQSIDLMPSLLKLAGLPIPEGVQGQDLFEPHERVFAEESQEGNVLQALRLQRAGSVLKLIDANAGNPRGLPVRELFRVDQDPGEQVDVSRDEPELTDWAQAELDQQRADAARGHVAGRSVDVAADVTSAERLRALGYAGGDKDKAD
jgi:arylsulfatase A-like enzyme/uncharacterized membrane protein YbhN (UPF0104 family)